jgi:mRNA-degrading endonuclease RelE of RelBE toxin-antitoxin system
MTNEPSIRIDYASQFQKDLKKLHKKYPRIQDDLQPLIDRLLTGDTPGDQVPGINYPVYKVRLRSRDQAKGKRGGFRVLYYIKTPEFFALVAIYPKATRADLSQERIKQIIEQYESK